MGYSDRVIGWLSPNRQMIVMLGVMFLWMFGLFIANNSTEMPKYPNLIWEAFITVILFYALINNLLSLKNLRVEKYWLYSILSYFALVAAGYGLAFLFSGKHITEIKSILWLLGLFTFVYFLLLSIVRAMRGIIEYVIKQDKKLRGEE